MSADQKRDLPTLGEHAAANPVAPGFAEEFRAGVVMAQSVAEQNAEVAIVTERPGLTQAQLDGLFHGIVTSQAEQADRLVLVEYLPGGLAVEVAAWSLFNRLEALIQRLPEDRRTSNAVERLAEARMWLEQLECDEWPSPPSED